MARPGRPRKDPKDKATVRAYISPRTDQRLTKLEEEMHQTRGEIIHDALLVLLAKVEAGGANKCQ